MEGFGRVCDVCCGLRFRITSCLIVAASGAEDNQHEEQHHRTRPDRDANARTHSDRVFLGGSITRGQRPDVFRWIVSVHHSMLGRGLQCVDRSCAASAGYRSMQTTVKE